MDSTHQSTTATKATANGAAAHRAIEHALLATRLAGSAGAVGLLHEELLEEDRQRAIASFTAAGAGAVVVCTTLAARGLDFPQVRHVVLYDMPSDVAGYLHSAGRTARQGREGVVSCLVRSRAEAGRFTRLHALQHAAQVW